MKKCCICESKEIIYSITGYWIDYKFIQKLKKSKLIKDKTIHFCNDCRPNLNVLIKQIKGENK